MANKTVKCRLFDESNTLIGELPDFVDIQVQDALNSECAWTMKYDRHGRLASELIQDRDLSVDFYLGESPMDFEGVIEQDNWDEVNDASYITIAGRGQAGQFEYALVYPKGGAGAKPAEQTFTNKTPGYIFLDLFTQAQARGALPGFSCDFDQYNDSSGNPWSTTLTITYKAGVNLLDILKNFGSAGYVDFRMSGKALTMYNARTTLGRQTGVVFRRGRDIASAPRSRDRRSIGTSWLLEGDDDTTVVRNDTSGIAARGRKERYLSQGGTKDTGTLAVVGDSQLLVYSNARVQKRHKLNFDPEGSSPVPWVDYVPGQYVDTDLTGTLENYRLIAMNVTMGSSGVLVGEITLNDIFAERELLLDERIKTLTGGSSGGGVSTQPPTKTPPQDTTTPRAPVDLDATTEQYDVPGGVKYSQITATWANVTQNTDGSAYTDHSNYEIQWWYAESPTLKYELTTPINTVSWSSLRPGVEVEFHVRAVDYNGHRSAYSGTFGIITAEDTTPPPVPSDPVVSNWLSTLRIEWDGKGSAGEDMPLDFKHVEVWYSPSASFIPGDESSVLYDYLPAKGASVVSGLGYGFPYYVRLIAVDTNDNRSAASGVASATTEQVVSTDIGGNVIDFSNVRFKDVGNLIPDGSFELAETAALIGNPGWVAVEDNPDGVTAVPSPKVLHLMRPSAQQIILSSGVNASPGQKIAAIFSYKQAGYAEGDIARLQARFHLTDGTMNWQTFKQFLPSTNTTEWTLREASYITAPANAVSVDFILWGNISTTTADLYVDQLEVRYQMGTVLIEDAAINNAKIATLAVNDANIANMNVGKLVAGILTADVTLSSRIKTADTGARVEINSGGIGAWNSSGTQTVAIAGANGSVSIIGNLRSGNVGRRIDINPINTGLPEIRFYPSSGSNYGFLNAFSPAGSASAYIGLNSGQFPSNGTTCQYRLYMTDLGAALETVRTDNQQTWGSYLELLEDEFKAGWRHSSGLDRGHVWLRGISAEIGVRAANENNSSYIHFRDNGLIDIIGKFDNYVRPGTNQGVFTGSRGWTSAAGIILSYGVTMVSTPHPLLTVYYTGAQDISWWCDQRSNTSFSVNSIITTNGNQADINATLNFWCFRT